MPKVSKEVRDALKAAKAQYGEVWRNYLVEQNREATLEAQEEIRRLQERSRLTLTSTEELRSANDMRQRDLEGDDADPIH